MNRSLILFAAFLAILGGPPAPGEAQEASWRQTYTPREAPSAGWIGVYLRDQATRMEDGQVHHVVIVEDVVEGSPAEAGGVRAGDIILRVNGEPIHEDGVMEQLRSEPGDEFVLTVQRGRERLDLPVVAAPRPAPQVVFSGPVGWETQVDSMTRRILLTADSLKYSLRLLEGKGPVRVIGGDTLHVVGESGFPGSARWVVMEGEPGIRTVEVTGEPGEITYRIVAPAPPSPEEAAPFGVFVRRSAATDSLLEERRRIRVERDRARQSEEQRRQELLAQLPPGSREIEPDDPRLVRLRETRARLEAELKRVDARLAEVSLEVLQSGEGEVDFTAPRVTVMATEGASGVRALAPYLLGDRFVAGAELSTLNPQLAQYFSAKAGVLVTEVVPGSPAHEAGLEAGDVITRVGDRPVGTLEELRAALLASAREDGSRSITVVRRDETTIIQLRR